MRATPWELQVNAEDAYVVLNAGCRDKDIEHIQAQLKKFQVRLTPSAGWLRLALPCCYTFDHKHLHLCMGKKPECIRCSEHGVCCDIADLKSRQIALTTRWPKSLAYQQQQMPSAKHMQQVQVLTYMGVGELAQPQEQMSKFSCASLLTAPRKEECKYSRL